MKTVKVNLDSNGYEIHIGAGILRQTGGLLKAKGLTDKLVIITNPVVGRLYGNILQQHLAGDGFKVTVMEVPDGEEQKSLETAGRLYHELTEHYAERTTPILALGGGVIGDLAGFVAATYQRGVPLVQIPTTLLAQVDSSIGGKVAVNHGQLKNEVGAFYQPKLVISDNGLAEVIKSAAIRDKEFFAYLAENLERVRSLDDALLEEIVSRTAAIKAKVVEEDERDSGLRGILNYGHTIGHAIESVSDFEIEHGAAVAIGMLVAGRISNRMGLLSGDDLARLKSVIEKAGLPTEIPGLDPQKMIQSMQHDKKVQGGKIRFILLKSIGDAFITDEVSPALIEQALAG
jgi:3-dehydroquinate synthase